MMVLIMRVFERNVAEEHVLMRRRTARAVLHAIDRACERCPGKHKRQRDAEHRTELVYRNHGRDAHDACLSSEFPCGKEMGSLVAVTGDMQLHRDATALPSPGRALALTRPALFPHRAAAGSVRGSRRAPANP